LVLEFDGSFFFTFTFTHKHNLSHHVTFDIPYRTDKHHKQSRNSFSLFHPNSASHSTHTIAYSKLVHNLAIKVSPFHQSRDPNFFFIHLFFWVFQFHLDFILKICFFLMGIKICYILFYSILMINLYIILCNRVDLGHWSHHLRNHLPESPMWFCYVL